FLYILFFFQAEDGIRDRNVTGVQTCALPISLKRGTVKQLKTSRETYTVYFPETGQAVYEKNRQNCGAKSKLLIAMEFIDYACKKILDEDWSLDAVVGFAKRQTNWKDKTMVSTKTLYNNNEQSKLHVHNIDLTKKLKLNTKTKRIRKHRRGLGIRIAKRPPQVDDRLEFGHWEIATGEGEMSDD